MWPLGTMGLRLPISYDHFFSFPSIRTISASDSSGNVET
jgi:hypothetical protein